MEISSQDSQYVDRMTVSCPPETQAFAEEREKSRNDMKKELEFVIERPERPGETSSVHGSRTGSCYSADEEEEDEEAANMNSPESNAWQRDEDLGTQEQPATDRFGFFLIENNKRFIDPSTTDAKTLRRREKKWIQMLDNWRYFMDEKFELVRNRCRKGIPPSLRGRAWKYLSGATYQMEVSSNRFVFDFCSKQNGDPKWNDDIQKDLSRQFPEHELFAKDGKFGSNGKNDLFDLLKAWTVLHPEEGYCQGQAPIAAVLLMHMPVRDAFYCFVQICHKYLPGYYSSGLEAVQIDGDILMKLLRDRSKLTYKHFKTCGVEPALYMIEWFMCVFCRTLPWPTVLRVWDMFLCEGVKILFKVALVLLKYGLGTPSQIKQFADMPAVVMRLRNLPTDLTNEEFIVEKIAEIQLNDADMEKLHFRAMKTRQMRFD